MDKPTSQQFYVLVKTNTHELRKVTRYPYGTDDTDILISSHDTLEEADRSRASETLALRYNLELDAAINILNKYDDSGRSAQDGAHLISEMRKLFRTYKDAEG
jgi:hypothetical protein